MREITREWVLGAHRPASKSLSSENPALTVFSRQNQQWPSNNMQNAHKSWEDSL